MRHRNEKLTVDRFEGDIAVCETSDGGHVDIPKSSLPESVREGDVVIKLRGEYVADVEETESRRKRILSLKNLIIKDGEE